MEKRFPYQLLKDGTAWLGEDREWDDDDMQPVILPFVERFVVPSEVDGHPVKGVYDLVIPPCDVLVFEEGICEIDMSGVYKSFREVVLPSSLKRIEHGCFSGTLRLEKVHVTAERVRPYAFAHCKSLREVTFSQNVRWIDEAAFLDCPAMKEIVLPDSLEVLCHPEDIGPGQGTFADCTALQRVHLGEGLREIWMNPFVGCRLLKEISISSEKKLFVMMEGKLVDRRRSMLVYAFPCELGKLRIPWHIMEIAPEALKGCEWLQEVEYLTEHVTWTRRAAFAGCASLREARIRGSLEPFAFADCTALQLAVIGKCVEIQEAAFGNCTSLREVEIESGAEVIEDYAFRGCDKLERVKLPGSVKLIGEKAFARDVTIIAPEGSFAAAFARAMGMPLQYDGEAEQSAMTDEVRTLLRSMPLHELATQEAMQALKPADSRIPASALWWVRNLCLRDLRDIRRGGVEKAEDLAGMTVEKLLERRLPVAACLSLMYIAGLM